MHPIATLPATATVSRVRSEFAGGASVVLVGDGSALLGIIDDVGLAALDLPEESVVTAGEICTVLPATAVSNDLTGQAAAEALKRARTLSRWLVVVEDGRMVGAVPTGAR
jgi:Zn-dependent protease